METLARVGLDDKADYQSRNLSYGERRRLEIARALSLNPSLLLLDEPVAGMRQGEAAVVADLLRSLCREGMTILLDRTQHVLRHESLFLHHRSQFRPGAHDRQPGGGAGLS